MGAASSAPTPRLARGACLAGTPLSGKRQRSNAVRSKLRAILLAFLTLLVMGSFAASAAYGEAGPFWHQRANEKEGEGKKIEEAAQQEVWGGGGEQVLNGTLGGTEVEIASKQIQIKGHIWNSTLRGQAKLDITYVEPKLIKPNLPNCLAKVGQNNVVHLQVALGWTWDGTAGQLTVSPQFPTQHPDFLIIARELQPNAKVLPEDEFTKITLSGAECGVLASTSVVKGSVGGAFGKPELKEWLKSTELKIEKGKAKQHWWILSEFVGGETELKFANNPASYKGISNVFAGGQQEVAVFEK